MSNRITSKKLTEIEIRLVKLKEKHRKIDIRISNSSDPILDPLLLQRLKKEKLILKDMIQKINNQLTPNIIA